MIQEQIDAVAEAVSIALHKLGLETIKRDEFFGMNQKCSRTSKLADQ